MIRKQSSEVSRSAEPQQEDASEPETRIAVHSLGETEIPAEPRRVAVTHQVVLDWLEPIGIKVSVAPQATQELDFQPYTPQYQREGMLLLGIPGDPNLEAILEAEPDLIIANWGHDKVYDQLSMIAPTLYFAPEDEWQTLLRQRHCVRQGSRSGAMAGGVPPESGFRQSRAVWKQISAVANNQVYPVESAFFSNTALAKSYQIDVVLEHLAETAQEAQ